MSETVIRSSAAYARATARVAELIDRTDKASLDELDELADFVDFYERRNHPIEAPTPLAAIRFRMRQAGLTPRDLEPYIGSRARVSETLSGARPLSLKLIRALHRHLGIPAEALIGEDEPEAISRPQLPSAAALKKLRDLGLMRAKESYDTLMERLAGGKPVEALLRQSRTDRTNAKTDQAALSAWLMAVKHLADAVDVGQTAIPKRGMDEARQLARLSSRQDGPALARDLLRQWGVILVTLDHLPGTFLDGAAIRRADGVDVIAVTLRHDRIDNFWFTLLHEFCHVSSHLGGDTILILDDLEVNGDADIEAEADTFAEEALVPSKVWKAWGTPAMTVTELAAAAAEAGVHPAIIAGRWQKTYGDYRRFSKLLGRGEIKRQFTSWT